MSYNSYDHPYTYIVVLCAGNNMGEGYTCFSILIFRLNYKACIYLVLVN